MAATNAESDEIMRSLDAINHEHEDLIETLEKGGVGMDGIKKEFVELYKAFSSSADNAGTTERKIEELTSAADAELDGMRVGSDGVFFHHLSASNGFTHAGSSVGYGLHLRGEWTLDDGAATGNARCAETVAHDLL